MAKYSDDQILKEYLKRFGGKNFTSLEDLITAKEGMGLETATPLQRAIFRIADGKPLGYLAKNKDVAEALGISWEQLRKFHLGEAPRELVVLSGIRTAKSFMSAAIAIWASQTCDVDHLRAGEIPRYSIVSLNKDLAHVVLNHLMGSILASPALTRLIYDQNSAKKWLDNGRPGADAIVLRHPSGRPVEIKVVSGKRAGASLVARWSAGVTFDEAPRMAGQDAAVINLDDSRAAVVGRLLPGACITMIGSPWAPMGPVYNMVQEHMGDPNRERVVIKAPGPLLNPYWWTEERCERLKKADPTAYRTDVLAEFVDIEESLLSQYLDSSTREEMVLAPAENQEYIASMDPGTRANAWTLVIATRKGNKKIIAYAQQWQGTAMEPLRPREVLKEVAAACFKYGIAWAITDQYAADALKDLAEAHGLELVIEPWTRQNKIDLFMELQSQFQQGNVEIPPDQYLIKDLRLVKRRVTQSGISIIFPETADKRHCDYAPAVARALAKWISDVRVEPPKPGEEGYNNWICDKMLAQELEEYNSPDEWWDR